MCNTHPSVARSVFPSFAATIGHTPLVRLSSYSREAGVDICVKLEGFNPMATVKDRPARLMIEVAEKQNRLTPGMTLIEASAGSTGFSLASLARARGYQMIIVAPDNIPADRRAYFLMLGARLVLTPAADRILGSYAMALQLAEQMPGALMLDQYTNEQNWLSHYHGTGPEIWRDTQGDVDMVVAGIGTGGTFTGIGRYLKERDPSIEMIAVEPAESSVLAHTPARPHGIFGLGPGFRTPILDGTLVDELVTVSTAEAYATAQDVLLREGIPVGPSSGATISAALKLAALPRNRGKRIVAMATDDAERYVSTGFAAQPLTQALSLPTQTASSRYLQRAAMSFDGGPTPSRVPATPLPPAPPAPPESRRSAVRS